MSSAKDRVVDSELLTFIKSGVGCWIVVSARCCEVCHGIYLGELVYVQLDGTVALCSG